MPDGARETGFRIRDALLLLEERERGRPETLIEELEAEATASLRAAQNLVDAMARQERLWIANGMNQAIDNPQAVIGGTFSRARWKEIRKIFQGFGEWTKQAPDSETPPPIVVISRRGNPPELPAPAQPTEEGETDNA